MMNKIVFPVLVLGGMVLLAPAAPAATPDNAPAPMARVAGGARVPLVGSALVPEQWSARRPKFRSLRPRARSNIE